jgi:hypothetical protein
VDRWSADPHACRLMPIDLTLTIDAKPDARHLAINMPLRAKARRMWRGARASNR